MPRPRRNPLFELGGQWIAHDPASPLLYRFWRDERAGRTRRASLGTTDLNAAKLKLAEIVIQGEPASPDTPLSIVLLDYFENHTDRLPSKKAARRAGRLLLDCWGDTVRVGAIDEAKQRDFAKRSLDEQGHALSYVARNLMVLAAALHRARIDVDVFYSEGRMRAAWRLHEAKAARRPYIPSDEELARLWAKEMPENLRRWLLIAMATGCRPAAALDLKPSARVRDAGLINLLPAGRLQTKKVRPIVRVPPALRTAMDAWERKGIDAHSGKYVGYASRYSVRQALARVCAADKANLPHLTVYSFRHKATTVMRAAKVPSEQISYQLGHKVPSERSTGRYGEYEPGYLSEASAALEAWIRRVQRLAKAAGKTQRNPKPHRQERKNAA